MAIDGSVPFAGRYSIFEAANADANGRITVRGFREEKKFQANLTGLYFTEVNSPLGALVKLLGAAEGTILGEVAVTRYPSLDLANVPYLIFPSYASPSKTSWGYAAEFDLSYPHWLGTEWNLTQSTVFTHDVHGISPNTLPFVEGRKSLYFGLLFDKGSEWKFQIGYTAFFGGSLSNLIRDRDNVAASLSFNF